MIRESDLLLTFNNNIKDDVEQCYDIDCEISHLGLFLSSGKFYSASSSASGCHLPDGTFWMDLPDGTRCADVVCMTNGDAYVRLI